MVLAVTAVTALAFWDHRRESAAALEDFAVDQATLAGSVVAELRTRLDVVQRDAILIADSLEEGRRVPAAAREGYTSFGWHGDVPPPSGARGIMLGVQAGSGRTLDLLVSPIKLLEGASRVERPGAVRLLLQAPEDGRLHGTDGSLVDCPPVQAALAADHPSVWLSRSEASALGLPPRMAAAGLARIDAGPLGRWGVAVVTTAERVRDRERRALYRLALGVLLAAGLVFAFGTAALLRQRQGLLLERRLALAALARERDADLATANRAATLGTLAMGIAHEVSTPLGIITGRSEQLLTRLDGDERGARSLRAILDQAERIRRVIRAFLDVVRGDAPTLGDTAPRAVLEGATTLVEHRFAAVGVSLDCSADPDLPVIHGDALLLQQAMVNLLLNACDACAPGGHVHARVARGGDGGVVFTVTDDGRGISKEEAVRAAEPFFTTKAPGQGSGLGLAIASEIVKLHRGKLALEPASPRGTRASVTVPVPEERAHAAA
jgi:signal transduction histidine kinase